MNYLCLVYYDEKIMTSMSPREWDDLNQECIACGEGLRERGEGQELCQNSEPFATFAGGSVLFTVGV